MKKKSMLQILLVCFMFLLLPASVWASTTTNKVLHLKFDGNYKDEVSGTTGTYHGDSKFVNSSSGKAAYFDGDDDYLELGNGYSLTGDFSLSVWIKSESKDRSDAAIFAKYETNGYGPYDFYLSYNHPALWVSSGSGSHKYYITEDTLPENEWAFLVFTYKKSTSELKIYVDNKLWGKYTTIPLTTNSDKVTVGRQALMFSPYSNLQYKGYMDDLRLYSSALSSSDIKDLYERKPETTPTPTTKPTVTPTPTPTAAPTTPYSDYTGEGIVPLTKDKDTVETTITTSKSEEIKGSSYPLLQARAVSVKSNSFKLKWNKLTGATRYLIYGNKCGRNNKYQFIKSTTKTYYKPKKLKKGTFYKYLVVGLMGDKVISISKTVHVGLKPQPNPTKVKLNKSKATLLLGNVGNTFQITSKIRGTNLKQHRKVCYETDNVKVAKVSKKGKITAVGVGTCNIYAYAQNGVSAKVKVKVVK